MRFKSVYILLSVFVLGLVSSCSITKRVKDNENLLTKNTVIINGKKKNAEEINNLIVQKKNRSFLGYPLRLHIYNLARENRDSLFEAWVNKKPKRRKRLERAISKKQLNKFKGTVLGFNNWLKKTGQAPVIIDSSKIKRSLAQLNGYHFNRGWFDVESSYEVKQKKDKQASITYKIETGAPSIIDSVSTNITSPVIDSLYQTIKDDSFIKKGKQWHNPDFNNEINRLTTAFRNSGIYHFSRDYISFENDTFNIDKKVNIDVKILDRVIRNEDSTTRVPFKSYKIKDVNIVIGDPFKNIGKKYQDSIFINGDSIYSYEKFRYKPKVISDAVFIKKDSIFRDTDRTQSYRFLNQLNSFRYPNITYTENPEDTTLTTNISLIPRKKFNLGFNADVSQNDIQSIGFSFSGSLSILNIFRGAETLQFSALGSIGASRDGSGEDDQFFDINEIGLNAQLIIPRLFFPFNTDKIIPKDYAPNTNITLGFTSQTNIGLDRQTFNGILNYNWNPRQYVKNNFNLFDIQFVRNLNPDNYFNVFQNSFSRLEEVALNNFNTPNDFITTDNNGNQSLDINRAVDFIDLVRQDVNFQDSNPNDFQDVNNIGERRERLIENNLISTSSFEYTRDNRKNLTDENFSILDLRLELAGNLLSLASNVFNLGSEVFGVNFSQYVRTEINYIKHWDLGNKNVLAVRNFAGIAIPYGNATSIPFIKSFFAGGANDNRAWTAYDLGPGSSQTNDEFNEANFKLAFNIEDRFDLFGNLKGAVFIDIGNIFNVLDEVDDSASTFTSFSDLQDLAIGTGFGLRYDFGFFVLRGDIGFKTYDPSFGDQNRWFNETNFANAVYNIGINYPF